MHEQTKAFCEADQGIIPHCGNPTNSAEDLKIFQTDMKFSSGCRGAIFAEVGAID